MRRDKEVASGLPTPLVGQPGIIKEGTSRRSVRCSVSSPSQVLVGPFAISTVLCHARDSDRQTFTPSIMLTHLASGDHCILGCYVYYIVRTYSE